jgi:hypothetical protein
MMGRPEITSCLNGRYDPIGCCLIELGEIVVKGFEVGLCLTRKANFHPA